MFYKRNKGVMLFLPLLILFGEKTSATEPEVSRYRFTLTTICDIDYGLPLYNITHTSLPQCSTACSDDEKCQSVTYDRLTRECRLSAAEALNPMDTGCDKTVEYAQFSTEVQSNSCTADENCTNGKVCNGDQCECSWGFRYNPRDNTCSAGCAKYGNAFQKFDGVRLAQHSDKRLENVTTEQAQELCLQEKSFICISIDCYTEQSLCQLSVDSIITHIADAREELEYVYFQRICV